VDVRRFRPSPRRTILVAIVTVSIVAAACGGGARASSTATTVAASSTTAPNDPAADIAQVTRVTTLGDSVPRGTACDCHPYPQLTAADLSHANGHDVTPFNDAVPGYKSTDVLNQVNVDAAVITNLEDSDAVMIEIGANDIAHSSACGNDVACYEAKLPDIGGHINAIISRVRSLTGSERAPVVLLDYWSVWLGGQYARAQGAEYEAAATALTHSFNDMIQSIAKQTGSIYVDLRTAFKGPNDTDDETELLAPDGEHPNAMGHRVIADAIARALQIQ
jgi:lysophospholipase L1-like esterase